MISPAPHTLEESKLHKVLVGTQRLQELSDSVVFTILAANALLVAWMWLHLSLSTGLAAGALLFSASAVNWRLLWALPRTGRSFGPDKPTALALTLLLTLILVIIGFVATSAQALIAGIVIAVVISLLVCYATWVEPFRLGLTRQTLVTSKLSASSTTDSPLRLLHVGDIHLERETDRERHLNRLIEQIKPDVIVFSGDFVSLSYTWDEQAKADIRRLLGAWRAPLGIYCVPGTPAVEPLPRVLEFVQGLDNLTLLPNRWTSIDTPAGPVHIFGHITTHDLPTDRRSLAENLVSMPKQGVRLMLTHSPDIAPEAAAAGFDLYLCGHTHGGQMRLPIVGALLSASQLGKRFVMGRYQVGQMTLYTTRGVGMEGFGAPRARFLCPPEIVLWEISGKEK
jgi:predicted MPP superfamily phosphohydrolase